MLEKLNNDDLDQVTGGDCAHQRYAYYTVTHGDNLVRIAYYFKTTEQAIMDANPIITDRTFIGPGWVLKVPDNR